MGSIDTSLLQPFDNSDITNYDFSGIQPLPSTRTAITTSQWLVNASNNDIRISTINSINNTVFDVITIGSGFTGISAAYHLIQLNKQLKICIIEQSTLLCGNAAATANNGGHMHPCNQTEINNVTELLQFANQHNIDFEYEQTGAYVIATNNIQAKELYDMDDTVYDSILSQQQCQQLFPQSNAPLLSARFNKYAGVCNPRNLVMGIASLVQAQSDNKFVTDTTVQSVSYDSNTTLHTLQTNQGTIQCRTVLHATNAYANQLLPQFKQRVKSVRNHVVATTPTTERLNTRALCTNNDFEYMIQRRDNSIILGGMRYIAPNMDELNDLKQLTIHDSTTVQALKQWIPLYIPTYCNNNLRIQAIWSGLLGFTDNYEPINEHIANGEFACVAFSGHGMPRCFHAAKFSAEMIYKYLHSSTSR